MLCVCGVHLCVCVCVCVRMCVCVTCVCVQDVGVQDDLLLQVVILCGTFALDEKCAGLLVEAGVPDLLITILKGMYLRTYIHTWGATLKNRLHQAKRVSASLIIDVIST